MINHLHPNALKRFSMQLILLTLLFLLGNSKLFSQCFYVTNEKGKETKDSIPCNFPMKVRGGNIETAIFNFNTESAAWRLANPKFKNILLDPVSNPSIAHIEIPLSVYNSFPPMKKQRVDRLNYFYTVIKIENK